MKRLFVVLALLLSTNTFAKGSSSDSTQDTIVPKHLPCFIQTSTSTWMNAYTITAFENRDNGYVNIYVGRERSSVETGEGKEVAYIQRMISTIQQTCK